MKTTIRVRFLRCLESRRPTNSSLCSLWSQTTWNSLLIPVPLLIGLSPQDHQPRPSLQAHQEELQVFSVRPIEDSLLIKAQSSSIKSQTISTAGVTKANANWSLKGVCSKDHQIMVCWSRATKGETKALEARELKVLKIWEETRTRLSYQVPSRNNSRLSRSR